MGVLLNKNDVSVGNFKITAFYRMHMKKIKNFVFCLSVCSGESPKRQNQFIMTVRSLADNWYYDCFYSYLFVPDDLQNG